ncbi:MAG: hypothetical protein KDA41_12235 [Planctomycetales bacterium]|nr:hypothetical protein [Planctomycetales bacterium]
MHACDLVHLAALVANEGQTFVTTPLRRSTTSFHEYWAASRQRIDSWTLAFFRHEKGIAAQDTPPEADVLRPVIEEILLSEVLTRVFAALCVAHDECHQGSLVGPVARSAFIGHQESRNRALTAILNGRGLAPRSVRRMNVLRQKCERWTDLLLAHIHTLGDVEAYAFDVDRMEDFAQDLAEPSGEAARLLTRSLTDVALQHSLRRGVTPESPSAKLNHQIAASVVACLPWGQIGSAGVFGPLWQVRMEHTTNETQELVDELLAMD